MNEKHGIIFYDVHSKNLVPIILIILLVPIILKIMLA